MSELGRRGGRAQKRKYSSKQMSKWAKMGQGGRPRTYRRCPGRRVHIFSRDGICWFCKKTRKELLLKKAA